MRQLKGKARERRLAAMAEKIRLLWVGATATPYDDDVFDLVTCAGAEGTERFLSAVKVEFLAGNFENAKNCLAYYHLGQFETPEKAAEHVLEYQEYAEEEEERKQAS